MRIILYTGKGGVGKTSVSAATALRAAQHGHRTVVVSTDVAHSLGDSFEADLSPEPQQIASNLWAQELDVIYEIRNNWGTLQRYLAAVLAWRGLDETVAEEMTVLPGMEELASLLTIMQYSREERYEVMIVDCAPTGEALRLLSFPEVARWWIEKLFPIQRKAATLLRPVVRPFMPDLPLPDDEVFESIKRMFTQLDGMHELLADSDVASVRLVLNPEKMVIKESQRTFTYLNLFGYGTDAVVCNRMLPPEVSDTYFEPWRRSQQRYMTLIDECFSPLPILTAPLFSGELLGREQLVSLADHLFGEQDPSRVYHRGSPQTIERDNGEYLLNLTLPFVSRDRIKLQQVGDELVIQVGSYRRNILLPRVLQDRQTRSARMQGDVLSIRFGGDGDGSLERNTQRSHR